MLLVYSRQVGGIETLLLQHASSDERGDGVDLLSSIGVVKGRDDFASLEEVRDAGVLDVVVVIQPLEDEDMA